jgi:hypothetical protein
MEGGHQCGNTFLSIFPITKKVRKASKELRFNVAFSKTFVAFFLQQGGRTVRGILPWKVR